jgi:hypothetical protein
MGSHRAARESCERQSTRKGALHLRNRGSRCTALALLEDATPLFILLLFQSALGSRLSDNLRSVPIVVGVLPTGG